MVYRKEKRKRSKLLVTILFPALLFIGIVGFCMYLFDNQYGRPTNRKSQRNIKQSKQDSVTLIPAVLENEIAHAKLAY